MKGKRGHPILLLSRGKPAGILLSVNDEDEIERLTLAYSPKFQKVLGLARQQIREGRGIRHEDFRKEVEDSEG
ncbi:MAG: prevent-host-death protein [Thermodesulfobacteriota bacterium]|nr:prevent-host-death protein [Thermodesulfobacteriota bacterium]